MCSAAERFAGSASSLVSSAIFAASARVSRCRPTSNSIWRSGSLQQVDLDRDSPGLWGFPAEECYQRTGALDTREQHLEALRQILMDALVGEEKRPQSLKRLAALRPQRRPHQRRLVGRDDER